MRSAWNAVIAEIVGTFLFFFVGMGSISVGTFAVSQGGEAGGLVAYALAHGLALAVLVSAFAAVSGAHFNPAVTFAVWLTGHIAGRRAFAYVLAQCIGGLAAAVVLRAILPAGLQTNLGLPQLAQGVTPLQGIAIEAILTGVLLVAVFGTAIDHRGAKIGGLAIGLAVAADIMMGGQLTGAAMNPARWLAPAAETMIWDNWYVWIVGPLLGAGVAALIYRFFLLPEADTERTPAEPNL